MITARKDLALARQDAQDGSQISVTHISGTKTDVTRCEHEEERKHGKTGSVHYERNLNKSPQRRHDVRQSWSCDETVCKKTYAKTELLASHYNETHLRQGPSQSFPCSKCASRSGQTSNLQGHKENPHKAKSIGSSGEKGKGRKLLAQDNKPDNKIHQRRKSQRDQMRKMQEQMSSAVEQA